MPWVSGNGELFPFESPEDFAKFFEHVNPLSSDGILTAGYVSTALRDDFHPGMFFRGWTKQARESREGRSVKQKWVRLFKENVESGHMESWITVTKRGRKRRLYRLTRGGVARLMSIYLEAKTHISSSYLEARILHAFEIERAALKFT